MAGTAFERGLTTRFAVATAGDDPAIRRLLRETPMRGAIRIGFEREPDYFRSSDLAGGVDQTIVAFDGEQLVCAGRCTHRTCWVNGRETRVGYLGELRLAEGGRGRFTIVRDGYRFFHSLQRSDPPALCFTSIAADNMRARRLLESGLRGLPSYGFLAELDSVLIAVPRRPRVSGLRLESATSNRLPDVVRLLNEDAIQHQLAAVWTPAKLLSLERHGLPLNQIYVAFEGNELVACGALWDQRAFRQTVVHSYAPPLSFARSVLNGVSSLLGLPGLPAPGAVLPLGFVCPLGFKKGAEALLPEFIAGLLGVASLRSLDFLTLARPANDPHLRNLRRAFTTRTYHSRLYRVDWPGEPQLAFDSSMTAFLPDVALL